MGFFSILFMLVFVGIFVFWRYLPEVAQHFLRHFLPLVGVLLAIQVLFVYYNLGALPALPANIGITLLRAIRLNMFAAFVFLLPYFLFLCLFFTKKRAWIYKTSSIFYLVGAICICLINLTDTFYFAYVHRHTTIADLNLLSRSLYLLPNYLKGLNGAGWLLLLFSVLCIFFIFIIKYKPIKKEEKEEFQNAKITYTAPFSIIFFIGFTLIFTGVFLPNPLAFRLLSINSNEAFWACEMNGAFSLIGSIVAPPAYLTEKNYFAPSDCLAQFNPHQKNKINSDKPFQAKNIILFFIESAPQEFFDEHNSEKPAMPFVDSLRQKSWVFDNAFASSTSTDDAFMTVVGGIPYFMRTSLPFSPYSGNHFEGIGHYLRQKGYYSSFYYGINNNSSGFGKYAHCFGVNDYHDLNNLGLSPNIGGIRHDHLFIPEMTQQISKQHAPFFTILFNTQTHTPFNFLPENIAKTLPKGKIDASQAFSYFDYTLRLFFQKAQKEPWFDNTIFVFVGDHYSRSLQQKNQNDVQRYRIPLWFYSPVATFIKPQHTQTLAHQTDITPTL